MPLPAHIGISLVLHKVVDGRQGVRDSARGLLSVLARRAWGRDARYRWVRLRYSCGRVGCAAGAAYTDKAICVCHPHVLPPCSEQQEAGGGPAYATTSRPAADGAGASGTVVVGSLANSYAAYQLRLSARLAKEHHELW